MTELAVEQLAYVAVYQVLEDVGFERRSFPPGTSGRVTAAIDRLRTQAAPPEQIRLAEQLALLIFKLERALRERDETSAELLRADVQVLGAKWMGIPFDLAAH